MKKTISIILSVLLTFVTAGCGSTATSGRNAGQPAGVKDVLENGMENNSSMGTEEKASEPRQSGVNEDAPKPEQSEESTIPKSNTEGVDVDLTALSSTMVYSEVYSMLTAPEEYIGKTVKMSGRYTSFHDETTGNDYNACIIRDATACCAQGIEFELNSQYTYPDDYPQEDEQVTVTGVFTTYQEGNSTYCTLRNAELK